MDVIGGDRRIFFFFLTCKLHTHTHIYILMFANISVFIQSNIDFHLKALKGIIHSSLFKCFYFEWDQVFYRFMC